MAEVELTSVASDDARRTPRVDFNAPVEVFALDDREATPRVIVAQAFDLGAGGIGLSLRERLTVGTHVTCRLTLDGRDAELGGRVVWQRAYTSPRPHGLGVCFDPLGEYERELLAHVVDRTKAGYRPVELRFGSSQTPVIARARNTPDGLRVSTPLPMLNQGTELAVRFEGEGQVFVGHVTSVAISEHDGTRRLEVDIALSDASNVRFRRPARYGHADEFASAEGAASPEHTRALTPDDELTRTGQRAARPRRRVVASEARVQPEALPPLPRSRVATVVSAGLRIAGSLLLAAACGAAASAWFDHTWSPIAAKRTQSARTHSAAAESARTQLPPASAPPAAEPIEPAFAATTHGTSETTPIPTSDPAHGAVAAATQSPKPPSAAPPPPATTAAVGDQPHANVQSAGTAVALSIDDSEPTTRVFVPAAPGATEENPIVPVAPLPSSLAPNLALPATQFATPAPTPINSPTVEPTLAVDDSVSVIAIPFEGSLDGMRTATWASPAAVAIDLPHGRARVLHGFYPLSGGNVAGLRVRQHGDELLVRVLLAQPVSRIAVTANGESLEVRLISTP